jgi:hypothetical protein
LERPLLFVWLAPSGPDPHEVVGTSDGRFADISDYNSGGKW